MSSSLSSITGRQFICERRKGPSVASVSRWNSIPLAFELIDQTRKLRDPLCIVVDHRRAEYLASDRRRYLIRHTEGQAEEMPKEKAPRHRLETPSVDARNADPTGTRAAKVAGRLIIPASPNYTAALMIKSNNEDERLVRIEQMLDSSGSKRANNRVGEAGHRGRAIHSYRQPEGPRGCGQENAHVSKETLAPVFVHPFFR
jgi:hypothetical protein